MTPQAPLAAQTPPKEPAGLLIIGVLKLVSAALLIGTGLGIFHLLNAWIDVPAAQWIADLHLTPKRHLISEGLAWVSGIDRRKLEAIGVATFLYATLYLVEGIGLLMRRVWAEYLTVIATGSFLPLELYEIAEHVSLIKTIVFAMNIGIVVYLVVQLRRGTKFKINP